MHHNTITRAIAERLHPSSKRRRRGKPSLLDHDTMVKVCQVAKRHIEQSGGYQRKEMIAEVIRASGGKLTLKQATNTWTHTVHPFGCVTSLLQHVDMSQQTHENPIPIPVLSFKQQCLNQIAIFFIHVAYQYPQEKTRVDKWTDASVKDRVHNWFKSREATQDTR